ncbi:aldehyde dehydrogenase family protein [Candidatus Roizmanbacteria bacterium]|nr:aldehyde dehydrogenase family protein [Candidatus Roizmanbacteria bacterium]
MNQKKTIENKNNPDKLLTSLTEDYFSAIKLTAQSKKKILSQIKDGIGTNKEYLKTLIVKEVKLTLKDAEREVVRAINTFALAEKHADYEVINRIEKNGKIIQEKRIPRGPLLVITPFSSPLSSPAHKIALGILAGTSILFKPSSQAQKTGKALYEIISAATNGKYIYFSANPSKKDLYSIVSDNRIGIISFTGGYETGEKIVKTGGVKKYHMELAGGNSPVIFTQDYRHYNDQTVEKLLDGILAKNGQRCVSIKHIFIPQEKSDFITKIQEKFILLKQNIKKDFQNGKRTILGPLINSEYARSTEKKVNEICQKYSQTITPLIAIERDDDYLYPSLYMAKNIDKNLIKNILDYDLPGPVVFIYFYKNNSEYKQILTAFQNDYIRSGLQLSFFTKTIAQVQDEIKNIFWGGIIINDIPTFRDEFMSFGGFGKAGLGKEGFFETINVYTDPKIVVYS